MEQWLAAHALQVIFAVVGGILVFDRLKGKTKQTYELASANRKLLEEHMSNSEFPHASCRVESERLRAIQQQLATIVGNQAHFDKKIDKVQERIIDVIQNGKIIKRFNPND